MNEIRLKNFRCFRDEQRARLAPLTLLVGENSTGKTSFMAMMRILSDIAYGFRNPDFKEDPYDLGSFDEVVHRRGARGLKAHVFEAGFGAKLGSMSRPATRFDFTFGKSGTAPIPIRRRISRGRAWLDETYAKRRPYTLRVGTIRGRWEVQAYDAEIVPFADGDMMVPPAYFLLRRLGRDQSEETDFTPIEDAPPFSAKDRSQLNNMANRHFHRDRPFASAPVRSKPRRTYDPSRRTLDPEGDYVPMYLAEVSFGNEQEWAELKNRLEGFGQVAGLFDEISIKRLGRGSEPFQVQVRKSGDRLKGPWLNLIDVGYGVSQVLPVITELLREDAPDMFLLQQPEVHLHPSAQAALGSLFCQVAGLDRQLVIETHSDHLMNRVRMDVRDGESALSPDDVSILYFEREDLDVKIHSLRIDEEGNILEAPDSYGRFFMEETARSLAL